MKKTISLLLIAILCFSCDGPSVSFEQPQPDGTKNLDKIPRKLRGKYFDEKDSLFLYISKNSIVEKGSYTSKELLDSLIATAGSSEVRGLKQGKDTSIVIREDGLEIKIEVEGDSALVSFSAKNTLFEISETNILRQSGSYYFLNKQKADKNNWDVQSMSLSNDILLLSSLPGKVTIDSLKAITRIAEIKDENGEVTKYKLTPTLKELMEIVKANRTSATRYRKVK